MKIRQGFVSNSSSSSFVICKKGYDEDKIRHIKRILGGSERDYFMDAYESPDHFMGTLSIHNVEIREKLKDIGVILEEYTS